MRYQTLEDVVGNTPLVKLKRMPGQTTNDVLGKLEGNNPAGSVKDRPALSMIMRAEEAGRIKPGDTLIEATSGNTGIALAMVAAMRGYKMVLVMPEHLSIERRQTMAAFGAKFVLTPQPKGMEGARDIAGNMQTRGEGVILDQFANDDNPLAHYDNTGREIWEQTKGRITHFVSSMGTTGTIMGVSKYLKLKNPSIEIIGCQPTDGSQIPGIRKWPKAYLPKIFESHRVDRVVEVSQSDAEETTRRMAQEEGIFAGISAGGAMWVALQLSETLQDSTIVSIVCDRGDRYLSTGVFPAE
jgi:cysteine synthase B